MHTGTRAENYKSMFIMTLAEVSVWQCWHRCCTSAGHWSPSVGQNPFPPVFALVLLLAEGWVGLKKNKNIIYCKNKANEAPPIYILFRFVPKKDNNSYPPYYPSMALLSCAARANEITQNCNTLTFKMYQNLKTAIYLLVTFLVTCP